MNARFESDHDYLTQHDLMMGLATGGRIGDIPSMSQSYRQAVLRNPPSGEFTLIVQPPVKQGSSWHYGGCVVPVISDSAAELPNGREFNEYTIWRKWEDCLDLQRTVEHEYSFLSFRRRRLAQQAMAQDTPYRMEPTGSIIDTRLSRSTHSSQSKNPSSSPVDMYSASQYADGPQKRPYEPVGLYSQTALSSIYSEPKTKTASFDSLPQGLEPLAVAVDVHTLIPKLSKKAALFGRPSPQLLAQRAENFKAFINALFQINTPVMDDLRQSRSVRDWFGYWKRDHDSAAKAGIPVLPSPVSTNPHLDLPMSQNAPANLTMSLTIPLLNNRSSSATSASSGSGSSSPIGLAWHDASGSDEEDEELINSFPLTPQGGPSSTPVIRSNHNSSSSSNSHHSHSHHQHELSTSTLTLTSPQTAGHSPPTSKSPPSPQYARVVAVESMIDPAPPMFRSRSNIPRSPSSATAHPTPPPSQLRITPVPASTRVPPFGSVSTTAPMIRTPRSERPSTASSVMNRHGRVFVAEPQQKRPKSASPTDPGQNQRQHRMASLASTAGLRLDTSGQTLSVSRMDKEVKRSATELSVPPPTWPSRQQSQPSTSAPKQLRATTMGYSPPHSTASTVAPASVNTTSGALASALRSFHQGNKRSMDSETGSFLDYALPAWSIPTAPASAGGEDVEPSVRRERPQRPRGPNPRGGRHSISSIESYLSDSSIDAALSTLRMASSSQIVESAVATNPYPRSSLRRSMSTGAASAPNRHRSASAVARIPEGNGSEDRWANDRNRERRMLAAALIDEDEDVVDSYFYSPSAASPPRPASYARPHASPPPRSPSTPTTAASVSPFAMGINQPHGRSNSISSVRSSTSSTAGFDAFNLKILFPSFTDCAAIALRLPRSTTFEELQVRLHLKFHEAEGIDLSTFQKGFRLGYRPGANRRTSIQSAALRSMSTGKMVDPSLLTVIKNEEDWRNAIPNAREKLTLQVMVDQ